MAKKKLKTGKVDFGPEEFNNDDALIRISMMLPKNLVKDLKRLSLNEEHSGQYQVLIRDVLEKYVEKSPKQKRAKSA